MTADDTVAGHLDGDGVAEVGFTLVIDGGDHVLITRHVVGQARDRVGGGDHRGVVDLHTVLIDVVTTMRTVEDRSPVEDSVVAFEDRVVNSGQVLGSVELSREDPERTVGGAAAVALVDSPVVNRVVEQLTGVVDLVKIAGPVNHDILVAVGHTDEQLILMSVFTKLPLEGDRRLDALGTHGRVNRAGFERQRHVFNVDFNRVAVIAGG